MSQVLYDDLQEHYKNRLDSEFVFPSPKTLQPFVGTNNLVRNYFKPLLKRLGIEYRTLYATRHSFGSNLINSGAPISYVQNALGHSTPRMTLEKYVKGGRFDSKEVLPILDRMYAS